jgi:hypothetical protein
MPESCNAIIQTLRGEKRKVLDKERFLD